MFLSLIPLVILAAIVAVIVKAVRSRGDGPGDTGPVTLRRFFQYATLYGVLVVVAIGFTGLLEQILPGGREVARAGSSAAARSLAFVIVGTPVYLGIGAWVSRQLDDHRERATFGWSFYLTATLFTALLIAGFAAFDLLTWAFDASSFDHESLARGIVWGVIWLSHWFIASRYLDAPRGEGHVLAGSTASLIALTTAIGFGLFVVLDALYASLFETDVASAFGDEIATGGAGLIVGGAFWWIYWLRNGAQLVRTRLWNGYVLLIGVLGGLFAAIGAASGLVFEILIWLLGDPEVATASEHFIVAPALIASGLVGLGLFFYHRQVLAEGPVTGRTEIRRVYEYSIAGVGLVGFAGGLSVLLIALLQQLVPATDVVAGESEVNTLIAAVTFLAVGGPLWWGFWSRIRRSRVADPQPEIRSRTRRVYLALLFGVGGLTALISLVSSVFQIIEDLLDGVFGGATISDIAPAVALVVTTTAIAAYHWQVYKEDRADAPEATKSPLREVILVGVASPHTSKSIADQLDVRVRSWDRLDGHPGPVDAETLIGELANETNERVMVLAWPEGHRVVPFAEQR